jgi:hypothetical protein
MQNNKKGQQFMPFDALKGLKSELKKLEEEKVIMPSYTDDGVADLEEKLSRLQKGDRTKIKYCRNNRFYTADGIVKQIDIVYNNIAVDRVTIPFNTIVEIYDIEE